MFTTEHIYVPHVTNCCHRSKPARTIEQPVSALISIDQPANESSTPWIIISSSLWYGPAKRELLYIALHRRTYRFSRAHRAPNIDRLQHINQLT